MLAGHLDEIGFIVTKIDNNGLLNSTYWRLVEPSDVISKVTITTDDGKEIRVLLVLNLHMYLNQKHVKVYRYQRYVY